MTVNLDDTKALNRIAAALEDISCGLGAVRGELLRINAFLDCVAVAITEETDSAEPAEKEEPDAPSV